MKYRDLYIDCKTAVRKEIKASWCGVPKAGTKQGDYKIKIDSLMDDIFAPDNAMPIVESMADYQQTSRPASFYKPLVTPNGLPSLWSINTPPYEHQVKCWDMLINHGKSIVVTTGTGSGKTECFMLPIAKDIIDNLPTKRGKVQAIFLYPLNALMEDQKLRLLKVLEGSDARFAIYNGNCPEDDAELCAIVSKVVNENPSCSELELAKIAAKRILGCSSDTKLNGLQCWADFISVASGIQHTKNDKEFAQDVVDSLSAFRNIVFTRDEIQSSNNHPEILLTNCSMIEYSLLRAKDAELYSDSAGSLKWFAIDETHTYSGAGAVELSMQIKRVLNAFGVTPAQVRFATSSATIGSSASSRQALEDFILGITGNKPEVIEGTKNPLPGVAYDPIINTLSNEPSGYLALNRMIPNGIDIESKLGILDSVIDGYNNTTTGPKIKVKVHFFFRVLNRGLKVCLSDIDKTSNVFNIHLDVPSHQPTISAEPYLELGRCCSCGEYIAIGQYKDIQGSASVFRAKQAYTDNLFSLDNTGNDESFKTGVFAYMDSSHALQPGSCHINVNGDTYTSFSPSTPYSLVLNTECNCPHCGKSLQTDSAKEEIGEIDRLKMFRLSSAKINQMISPAVLAQVAPTGNPADPHQGQQFLTFVDSRKDAAKATLEQNLKIKQEYVYQLVYNELLRLNANNAAIIASKQAQLPALQNELNQLTSAGDIIGAQRKNGEILNLMIEIRNLQNCSISFKDMVDILSNDPNIQLMFEQSIDDNDILQLTGKSNATDTEKQEAIDKLKKCFVYGLAYELLAKRHVKGFSPEAIGLFYSTYPIIDNANLSLPQGVQNFNAAISNSNDQISVEDWKNLLTIAMNQARSNESMFIKYDNGNGLNIDIHTCRRFAADDSSRKPLMFEQLSATGTRGRSISIFPQYAYLLASLLAPAGDLNIIIRNNISLINGVIQDINDTLKQIGLSEIGQVIKHYNGTEVWENDKDDNGNVIFRLNVDNIAFKLYGKVAFCEAFGLNEPRPTAVLFKGKSPFFNYGDRSKLNPTTTEDWTGTYQLSFPDESALHSWAAMNRPQIWNSLWDNDGLFASRLDIIYLYDTPKDFFLQAEHTAQIEKSLSRLYQSLFQEHKINILACSTTMEMGVDLGDLEVVMMNSVPPAPSNYKQRAGRSGRGRGIFKSAAITLCGSDSIGARTLRDPYGMLIGKSIVPPRISFVDNERIIQRHVNAYCFRRVLFDQWIPTQKRNKQNILSFKVRDFYTLFTYDKGNNGVKSWYEYNKIKDKTTGVRFFPQTNAPLGSAATTAYTFFKSYLPSIPATDCKFLLDVYNTSPAVQNRIKDRVESMLDDTYDQLKSIAESIGASFEDRCNTQGWSPNNPADQNNIDSDPILSGITKGLSKTLEKRFIEYLATSRFTPNANMPVDVLEFDVNYSSNSWMNNGKSNPSYQLREALSQYSPGNKVVLKNAVYTVGGVSIKGLHRDISDLDYLLHTDKGRVVDSDQIPLAPGESWLPWDDHSGQYLRILRPYAFLPENQKDQKARSANVGIVKSQLVGVDIWQPNTNPNDLLNTRSSNNMPNSTILYYNDGYGYGFSFCRKCGKTIVEILPYKPGQPSFSVINDHMKTVNNSPIGYHMSLRLFSSECSNNINQVDNITQANKTTILRHAVIGDYIQTDFTEFRFFWPNNPADEQDSKFLNAMGVLLCQAYSELAGIERKDLDFTITADNHLCIFDAYNGGAGNADKLSDAVLMEQLIQIAYGIVTSARTTSDLFDKFTLRYEDRCDFITALDWINAYNATKASVPSNVSAMFPNFPVTTSSKYEIETALRAMGTNTKFALFSDLAFNTWSAQEPATLSKIKQFLISNNKVGDLCLNGITSYIPVQGKQLLSTLSSWNRLGYCASFPINGIYPLAIVGSTLFFTTNKNSANLNEDWAQNNPVQCLYKVPFATPVSTSPLQVTFDPNKDCIFFLDNPTPTHIDSSKLYGIVKAQNNFIDRYINSIPASETSLDITYEDQYLKSRLAIILSLQFIRKLIYEIKSTKPNITKVNIMLETEQYNPRVRENYDDNSVWMNLSESVRRTECNTLLQECSDDILALGIAPTITFRDLPSGAQEHWRALKVSCPNCEITISPNGGFNNEWKFDKYKNMLEDDPVNIDSDIPIYRTKAIKYDIQLSGSAIK